ncbi:TPM domain-containing protein [Granulicella arctica]|uniref:TPM domain-containing protein n=1 Tax=Granulicella arctica TaxID=940613 RepID=UPI0021DFA51D|nr:TPM domain-containing protein [Granulicella arctica]
MKRFLRWVAIVSLVVVSAAGAHAEKIKDLPAPTSYVSDFAGVLDPATKQSVEDLCVAVDRQAHAQIAVVTIKTLDDDQPIEEAATELEEKWKDGAKGTDRGVLMLLVMNPVKGRIEVGYGLEGILNDAKVGDIGRAMEPYSKQGDYNEAIPLGVQQLASVIAADANVTLTTQTHRYHRVQQQQVPVHLSLMQIVIGGGLLLLVIVILASTGNLGILWFILGSLLGGGGGGGGGGRDDDRGGGGFGGFGGGSSGGGGASGNF